MRADVITLIIVATVIIIWVTKELVEDVLKRLYFIEEKLNEIQATLKSIEKSNN